MARRCVPRERLDGNAAALDSGQVRPARDAVHGHASLRKPGGKQRADAAGADHAHAVWLARADGRGVHGGAHG